MKSPFTGKEMTVVKEWREMTYRKEQFNVLYHFYRCEGTEEQFENDHFATLNYNQVVNQYRVRHRIPFPEQIKKIRQKYGLSAAKMSKIMGMGPNSWRNYEGDEVPSKVHANLILMISDAENFKEYIEKYSELEGKEREKILLRLKKLETDSCCCDDSLLRFESLPDITNGFKAFDKEKTKNVILFFAEHLKPFKTKLNKLLFYSDFAFFRQYAQSMTGLKYKAISYGPVPNNYDILFGLLAEQGIIDIDYSMTEYGEVERIILSANYRFDKSLFSAEELEILHYISDKFKDTTASDIAELSHKESAWQTNINGNKIISFHHAFSLETA
ncbi:MAG: type II toxin-antitoxin system antitoxin SocA domain-containing protein [Bacteroidota bacterium]